ncbi:MAG: zinc ABC transporter solute-binding protein [Phycisphaerae bacterium]|nr:zinc ABC transporter substrate-binding protein [Phycisphaerae bacterium]NIS54301.1 zinc ABC transporter substrate-binding protein [Phycisphaerae bacterium]NIV01951.1 zinc ABC transporter solute-binding protein [Phycisphaerae bacterium]
MAEKNKPLRIVTTLSDYAVLTRIIGGDRVTVDSIVHSVQDPHHIRPKPSFVHMVKEADMLVSTGLDLEMWLPTVINKSGNKRIRSGEIGYVAVSQDIELIEKPKVVSQIEGDVHIFGNPHLNTSPINTKKVARNIAIGLIKNDPEGKEFYEENLKKLHDQIDKHMFGEELVKLLGGHTLCRLAQQGKLIDFLKENKFQGKPLIDKLGGWMGKMLPLREMPVVVYHKNWSYLLRLFGLEEAGTIETKPGIPPSLKHVTKLVNMMRERDIRIILAANYFDEQKVRTVADRTGAKAVVAPLFVGGAPETDDYFKLVDYWTDGLIKAAKGS